MNARQTWSTTHASVLGAKPVAYFLGEVRSARIGADLFRRSRRAFRRSYQKRERLGDSARRHRLVLRSGLFQAASRYRRYQREEYLDTKVENVPMEPAIGADGQHIVVKIDTPMARCGRRSG